MIKLKQIITEEQMKYKIFCDMDGVLTNFDEAFLELLTPEIAQKFTTGYEYEAVYGPKRFWSIIDKAGLDFWQNMPWMDDGQELWEYISKYDTTEILSAPSKSNTKIAKAGKKLWIQRELRLNGIPKINLPFAKDKQLFSDKNKILIDDIERNITQWKSKGGIGILHTSTKDTIQQLSKLGL